MTELLPAFTPEGLYTCVHRSAGDPADTGVVVVQPVFGELIQHHRAFVVLADRLARSGIPTVRYDHHGEGDSAGDTCDASVEQWVADVGVAAGVLQADTGVGRIHLFGARFGALVAMAAAQRLPVTAGLLMWEPVTSGRAHLDELTATHRSVLGPYVAGGGEAADAPFSVLGFQLGERLWSEIEAFRPSLDDVPLMVDVGLVADASVLAQWPAPEDRAGWSTVPAARPHGWLAPDDGIYDVLVPDAAVQRLAAWVEERV